MILYFSGTGNTLFVARRLSELLGERTLPLVEVMPETMVCCDSCLIFCFPIYSWGVPPVVLAFIARMGERAVVDLDSPDRDIYMVATCGDEVARAPEMLRRALSRRGLTLRGAYSVTMPNNYVLLPGFDVDPQVVEERKLAEAPARIAAIADSIRRREETTDVVRGSWARLKTALVYPLFRRWGVFPGKWRSEDSCVGCGACERACPVGNIALKEGRPVWGCHCLSCTACYHACPVRAVAYGAATRRKGQYRGAVEYGCEPGR